MITSAANSKVKQVVQWQSKARERREADIFLTEGFKMFLEAPSEQIREVYLSEDALEKAMSDSAIKDKLQLAGYETVSDEVFRRMSDTKTPQGILCVMRRPSYSTEQMICNPAPLLVLLEGIQDPGNLGTILRTGEGAGITGVIADGQTVDIFNPKTIRATMGSIFRVPFICVESLGEVMRILQEKNVCTYAAHLSGETYYDRCYFDVGTAFLIGNEGNGLSPELAAQADRLVKIPMEGQVESLNASVAAALLMYEAHRQRRSQAGFKM